MDGVYEPIPVFEDADGILRGFSARLGLDICVRDDSLKLYDPVNRDWLRNLSESEAARTEAETARVQAEAVRAETAAALAGRGRAQPGTGSPVATAWYFARL